VAVIVKKQRHYCLSKEINDLYVDDEFKIIMPYGGMGIGKSALAIKAGSEILGSIKEPDFETLKDYIVFHPNDFLEKILSIDERKKFIIWDDAGVWLNALDYANPFVKAISKYINVGRTDFAAIICTTPLPTYIATKIRQVPDAITIKSVKASGAKNKKYKYRLATAYNFWIMPDMQHTGVNYLWEDDFSAMIDDDFYKWYKPYRDHYAAMVKQIIKKEIDELKKKNIEYSWNLQKDIVKEPKVIEFCEEKKIDY